MRNTQGLFVALLLLLLLLGTLAAHAQTSQYQVKFVLDTTTLKELYESDQAVLLVHDTPVGCWFSVWATVSSLFPNNFVSWNTSGLSVFASDTTLTEGGKVYLGSYFNGASPGYLYDFNGAVFNEEFRDWLAAKKEIAINNNSTTLYTFGLAQDIQANNRWSFMSPLYACELLPQEYELFKSEPSFYIFIGSASTAPGMITKDLRQLARSRATRITLSANTATTLTWDRPTGRFIQL